MYTIHDNSTWNLHIPRSLTYRLASKAWWQSRRREASFVHRDPVKGGHTENTVQEKSVASPFDVTTYLPVDRPTHPYKQGLLERNRNNLYPKGLGRAIACRSVTTYRPYASCMHTHVFVAALSRDPGIFVPREHEVYGVCVVCVCVCVCVCTFCALLLRNQSTAALPATIVVSCLSFSLLSIVFASFIRDTSMNWKSLFRTRQIKCMVYLRNQRF